MGTRSDSKSEANTLVKKYILALKQYPILTKSCTSALVACVGNIIAQAGTKGQINLKSAFAYSATGLIYVGPTMHIFYQWLEKNIPSAEKGSTIKRIILDRFILAPPWLLVYFYLLSRLEGLGHKGAVEKIKQTFWEILKNNWKVWTIFQYVNVNYVPQHLRVLFASCLAFFWNIYVAYARR